MQADTRRHLFIATLLILFALLTPAAGRAEDLSGRYAITGRDDGGAQYVGEFAIQSRAHGFDVSWQRDGRTAEGGFGLTLNHVLGVAYWPENEEQEPGIGLVIYRIDGGTLDGIWLPQGAHDRTPGREVLSGSPDLTGRFQITLGVNPGGGSHYSGYADFERSGEHIKILWHAPTQVFAGSGIKIGNVLAVAYAYTRHPAIAAYCSNGRRLEGSWWTGPAGQSGKETLTPVSAGGVEQLPSSPQRDPVNPCNMPIAANF
jgi:hypothetical protein